MDGSAYYIRKAKPGGLGYEKRNPGETRVRDVRDPESAALFYKVPRGFRRAFRRWLETAFAREGERRCSVDGSYGDLLVGTGLWD